MSMDRNDEAKSEDLPIEAGEVGELHDLSFHEAKHRAETAKTLCESQAFVFGPLPTRRRVPDRMPR
jgi:hypothetical protein